jgi:hypothetical protein
MKRFVEQIRALVRDPAYALLIFGIAGFGTLMTGVFSWPRPFAAVEFIATGWLWCLAWRRA